MTVLLLVTASILWFGQGGTALPQHPFRGSPWKSNDAGESNEVEVRLAGSGEPKTHWIKQPLDHFDAQVTDTWKQRYFVNSSFFDGTGPVFLCVGELLQVKLRETILCTS